VAVFEWQGIDARGKATKGVQDAESAKALRLALRKKGILITSIEEESAARIRTSRDLNLKRYFQRVTTADVAIVTRQLATLLKAGVPLVEALTAIIEQLENPFLRSAFTQTRDRVNEGVSLADALRAHPKVFPTIYVNMVAAGEASGTLDNVLERLAELLDAQAQLRSKITSATIYPVILLGVAVIVISIMMVFVVPKVTAIYADFQQSLPWYTNVLIFVSDFMVNFWWLLIAMVVASVWGIRRWKATPKGQITWDDRMLKLPLFGEMVRKVAVARFARTLSTLLTGGVPVLTALDITRNVMGNVILMQVVDKARDSIQEGESIAEPLKRSGQFPPIVTHMIAVGERSGQLDAMLEHVATAYDNQVDMQVSTMTRILEPLMIVLMSVIVGGIVFAMLIPLMKINEFV